MTVAKYLLMSIQDYKRNMEMPSKDIYAAPSARSSIMGVHLLGAFIIGVIMSLVVLFISEGYIWQTVDIC